MVGWFEVVHRVTMSSSFVTSTKTTRTIKSGGGGGGFDDDVVSSKSSRNYQVYRGMSPTTSNRMEVRTASAYFRPSVSLLGPVFPQTTAN